jgi:hypothetical protein
MSCFTKQLARKKIDTEYIMKMEQESSDNPHFHIQMFADGNKIKDHKNVVEAGEKLFAHQLGLEDGNHGLIQYSSPSSHKNGIMLRRNSPKFQENLDRCFKQASYLAKQKPSDQVDTSERKIFYSNYRSNRSRSSR